MQTIITDNYDALSRHSADMVAGQVAANPASIICFASGETPTGMLKYLVNHALEHKVNFSECRFIGLDEWVGLGKDDEASCGNYLYTNFFTPLSIRPENIMIFNGLAEAEEECNRMNAWLQANGPVDIMIVGIGLNGHIGLNEPGSDFDSGAHVSNLTSNTITTAQKYFSRQTSLVWGITLGLKNFSEATMPILMASGQKKAAIIHQALQGPVNPGVPASILQRLTNAYVILDKAAASLLSDIK